mgnify:FL=1
MKVCTAIPVLYAETDKIAVVYHANYLLYFEDARTRFLEELGYPYARIEQAGYMSPVVSFEVRYGEPLRYGDVAIVRTWVSESRGTKTTYSYEVFKQGDDVEVAKPCVTGTSTHCLVDSNTFKPVSIKRTLPELFDLYEQVCER